MKSSSSGWLVDIVLFQYKTELLKNHFIKKSIADKLSAVPSKSSLLLPDLEFVKKFTRPNFQAKEFYTLKTRKSRLFSLAINSENASLSVIWPSFG